MSTTNNTLIDANKKPEFKIRLLWFCIISFCTFLVVMIYHRFVPFIYGTNDDLFLCQLVSGEFTGIPEAQLFHIGYLTGLFLSTLYKIIPTVGWYGLFLFILYILSFCLVLTQLVIRCKKLITKLTAFVVGGVFFYLFLFQHVIKTQFTTGTIIVAAASLVMFYFSEDDTNPLTYLKSNIISLVLFFIALNIRNNACLMLMLIFLPIGAVKLLKNKKNWKSLLAYFGTLSLLILLVFGINTIMLSSSQWQSFKTYSINRSNIYDYSGFPNYDTHHDTYNELGITYESYVAASSKYMLLLDENIDDTAMEKLSSTSDQYKNRDLSLILRTFIDRQFHSFDDYPMNLLVYLCYILFILLAIASGNYLSLPDIAAVFLGRSAIWGYLLYIGRLVPRVTQGLYITEAFLLFAIVFQYRMWQRKQKSPKYFPIFWGIAICAILLITAKPGYHNQRETEEYAKTMNHYSTAYTGIKDYFFESPQNLYLCDVTGFTYFTQDIFEPVRYPASNFLLLGGWTMNSPWINRVCQRYQITSMENESIDSDTIRYVFMNGPDTSDRYFIDYFAARHPDTTVVLEDRQTTFEGVEFLIYKIVSDTQ